MTTLEYISRHAPDLPLFINISGRFTMSDIYSQSGSLCARYSPLNAPLTAASMAPIMEQIAEHGFYELVFDSGKSTSAGKVTEADVCRGHHPEIDGPYWLRPQIDEYATWPIARTLASMPPVSILTLPPSPLIRILALTDHRHTQPQRHRRRGAMPACPAPTPDKRADVSSRPCGTRTATYSRAF